MAEKRTKSEAVAEGMREVGVLVFVFHSIEHVISRKQFDPFGDVLAIVVTIAFYSWGLSLEYPKWWRTSAKT